MSYTGVETRGFKTPDTGVRGAPRCLDKSILPDLGENARIFGKFSVRDLLD